MPYQNGSQALGRKFDCSQLVNKFYRTAIEEAHGKLLREGISFLGWHGTDGAVAEKLINGTDAPRASRPRPAEPWWNGFYVGASIEMAIGYCTEGGKIYSVMRVYVPDAKVERAFVEASDINDVSKHFGSDAQTPLGAGRYIIRGPDGTTFDDGQLRHEVVVSEELTSHLVFLPSTHLVTVKTHSPRVLPTKSTEAERMKLGSMAAEDARRSVLNKDPMWW